VTKSLGYSIRAARAQKTQNTGQFFTSGKCRQQLEMKNPRANFYRIV
jgi:hypothetical protein